MLHSTGTQSDSSNHSFTQWIHSHTLYLLPAATLEMCSGIFWIITINGQSRASVFNSWSNGMLRHSTMSRTVCHNKEISQLKIITRRQYPMPQRVILYVFTLEQTFMTSDHLHFFYGKNNYGESKDFFKRLILSREGKTGSH